ncbi:MAG: lipid II:glycine glycyltransferase FemX [Syntrophobacteraceae bacterium]
MPKLRLLRERFDDWDRFVLSRKDSTVYQTSQWLFIIKEAYGHQPCCILVEDWDGEFVGGLPLVIIRSNLTGTRLTSVPGGETCNPLVGDLEVYDLLVAHLFELRRELGFKYVELRTSEDFGLAHPGLVRQDMGLSTYLLGLDPPLDDIFSSFHSSCIRRPIRKSTENGLVLTAGQSEASLREFYTLYYAMRKGYGLLPQPYIFFSKMRSIMAPHGKIEILSACHGGRTVSSVLLLKHGDMVHYEYGASLRGALHLHPSHFLLWAAIRRAKEEGFRTFNFGRTSDANESLSQFKARWGTRRQPLAYYHISGKAQTQSFRTSGLLQRLMSLSVRSLPDIFTRSLSKLLYPHLV